MCSSIVFINISTITSKIILILSISSLNVSLMHASKGILNLPTSGSHLCSPFQPNREVKIRRQFTSFPKQLDQDSPPRK